MIIKQSRAIAIIALIFYGGITFAQKKADSIKSKLENRVKDAVKIDSNKFKKVFNIDKKLKTTINDKINQSPVNSLFKKTTENKGKKISLKDFSVENSTQYIKTESLNPRPDLLNNLTFSGQLEIFKLPLDLSLVNNYNPLNNFDLKENNLFKFDFIKPQLNQLYLADLNKYKNFKNKILGGVSVEEFLKKGIQNKLQDYISNKTNEYPQLKAFLDNPAAIHELLSLNESQIKTRLTTLLADVKNNAKEQALQTYQNQKTSINNELQAKVNELSQYIKSVKQEINASGLDEQTITILQKFAENKVTEKDLTDFFIQELGNQPKLKGIQKFYSRIKEFQAGNFGHELPGGIMNQNLFLNGMNFSLKTLRGPVNVGIAANKDIDQPKDFAFNRSTFSYPKLFTYISVPTTNFSFGNGKLSWVGVYDKQFSTSLSNLSSSLPRNNLVFTVTQNLNINNLGKLTVDISKSATQYKNLSSIAPDQLFMDKNTMGNYFRDDFLETMSVGLNHSIDSRKLGLNSNLYFNYSGTGFQNPGQQGISNMNMRFGGNVKQNFFKNKLSLYLKSDIKNTPISAETNAHWRNYNVQFDSRYRISKSYTLNLKYIENGVSKIGNLSQSVYHSKKIQADFNANYKIGTHHSFSHLTFSKQEMISSNTLEQPNFLQIIYAQNLLFKNFSLSGNLFYNKELNSTAILGNMVNSDIACQYTLFKTLSFSSGITYLNNQNIAKQVGFKQNLQFMLKKHFDISAFIDLRKNLINPLYPDLFSTGRAEFSIRYYLDKQ